MPRSSVLTRVGLIANLFILLIAGTVGASPGRESTDTERESAKVVPGVQIPLYASYEDSFTQVKAPANRASRPPGVTMNITYNGSWDPQAQAAFQYAADLWAQSIVSSVPIVITANWTVLPPGVLGSAGPNSFRRDFNNAPVAQRWYPDALADRLAGVDLAPGNPDIVANFSSSFPNWYFGTNGETPAGDYDFASVVLHELGHGLSFVGSGMVSGGQGSWGSGTGLPFMYDSFVRNGSGTSLTDTQAFPNPSAALAGQLQGESLFFGGPAATAANGGTAPKLYAPSVWQQGSSFSHLDETVYPAGDANSLMTPQIGTAEAIHDPGAVTLGIFTDLGWQTSPLAQASIGVNLTVGTDSQTCASTDSITVPANTPVFYCYMVTNTGPMTLTQHTIVDDQLGSILSNYPYQLGPSDTTFMTATTTINQTTVTTAEWTATNGTQSANGSDTATVTVGQSRWSIYVPWISVDSAQSLATLSGAGVAARPVSQIGETFYTGNVTLPAILPSSGHLYLSSSPQAAVMGKVDDMMLLKSGSTTIFGFDYRVNNQLVAQLVEVPISALAPYAGQTITIEFKDVSGGFVSATPLYLYWQP